jgi:hypothetical protein
MSTPVAAATAKKTSVKERKEALKEEWQRARGVIFPSLIDFLRVELPSTWVKATDLFNESTLPDRVTKISFLKAIFQHPAFENMGSTIFYSGSGDEDSHRCFVHRHRFGPDYYLCGGFLRRSGELEKIIKADIWRVPQESNVPDASKVQRIRSKLTVILKTALAPVVDAVKRMKSGVVTPESGGSAPQTQVDGAVERLQVSRNPASLIKNLDLPKTEQDQVIVRQQNLINKLTEKSNRDDAIINRIHVDNKITAIEVLEMFREDVSRKNFVDRLLQSNEVSKSLSLCPRARGGGTFEGLSESYRSNVIQTMADIAIKVAQLLN